jgi:uncharacterized C2H2 Zn-finger protein
MRSVIGKVRRLCKIEYLFQQEGGDVASWALRCPNCGDAFKQLAIHIENLGDHLLPVRPLVKVGSTTKCPRCESEFRYRTFDLKYDNTA